MGAAWLAGMHVGVYQDQAEFAANWALERRFMPKMAEQERAAAYTRWKSAVAATLTV